MEHKMRRFKQLLSDEVTEKIFIDGTSGVLAVCDSDGFPYAVPVSYVYYNKKIFIHGAKSGHKISAITANPKVSFCVVAKDQIVPQEYTTYFKSAIAFGTAKILSDDSERFNALRLLGKKYFPSDSPLNLDKTINDEFNATCVIEIEVERMSGKQAIELVRGDNKNAE